MQWLNTPAVPVAQGVFDMNRMAMALPSNPRGRGRGGGRRRGRGRRPQAAQRPGGQPSSGIPTRSGAVVIVRDTEIINSITGSLQTYSFNPGNNSLPRLAAHAKMYHRYRIKYMNIAFKSGSGTATDGNVAVGVCVGTVLTQVKQQADVMKLKPSFYVPAWKNDSLTVGRDIDINRFMICGDNSLDGVAFTLYVLGTANVGMLQVSYEVEFSHPNPF